MNHVNVAVIQSDAMYPFAQRMEPEHVYHEWLDVHSDFYPASFSANYTISKKTKIQLN